MHKTQKAIILSKITALSIILSALIFCNVNCPPLYGRNATMKDNPMKDFTLFDPVNFLKTP
jgi:hypothetical protein